MRISIFATALVAALALASPALHAETGLCDALGTKRMVVAELFFGRDLGHGRQVSEQEWEKFVRDTLAPAVPGFTLLDAFGQYSDANGKTHRERTKYVIVALNDVPASYETLQRVIDAYIKRFRQNGVGLLLDHRCGRF